MRPTSIDARETRPQEGREGGAPWMVLYKSTEIQSRRKYCIRISVDQPYADASPRYPRTLGEPSQGVRVSPPVVPASLASSFKFTS